MDKTYVPLKTLKEQLAQVQSEKESHRIQIAQLFDRENTILKQLGLPLVHKSIYCDYLYG